MLDACNFILKDDKLMFWIKLFTILLFLIFSITSVYSQSIPEDSLYFGQAPPGDSAVVFAPGIVSFTSSFTGGIAFSPKGDECCYGRFDGKDWTWGTIYYAKYVNNKWSKFLPAPFLDSTKYFDILPSFSPDGNRFMFSSARPSRQYNLVDLWMCERTSAGWSQPVRLDSTINNPNDDESFSSTALNGNIYFNKDLTNSIWFSSSNEAVYSKVSKVSEPVNSKYGAGSAFIAPDESYIIFASIRPEGYGERDLYISFRKPNSTWTEPGNLGLKINDTSDDYCPFISPDKKYLFFTKGIKRKYSNIYWVSANIINEIKKRVFNQIINK
jgi:hypothetical protein